MAGSSERGLWCAPAAEYEPAVSVAREFLRRWTDPVTDALREELVQDAAVDSLIAFGSLRDRACFAAFVRTITRRTRVHAVRERVRSSVRRLDFENSVLDQFAATRDVGAYPVRGVWVDSDEMLGALPRALTKLSRMNALLLLSYYEGFSISELAVRFDLAEGIVKVRIHRSRCRVRQSYERMLAEESGELHEDEGPRRSPNR